MRTDFRAPTPRGSNSRLACATTRARLWPSPLDNNASTKPDGRCSKGSAQVTSHFSAALDQHYPQAVMLSLYACSRVNSRREFRSETNPAARAAMNTLYDLLGALPHDNAEALRAAFRRAVKGAHPDVRPDDPEAALKFREIVRANDILGDDEQRAAYDHLLELARLEHLSEARHAIAARVHKLASGVIAMAGASVVTVGGYLLFVHMSVASVATANDMDVTLRATREIIASGPTGSADTSGESASPTKRGGAVIAGEANVPDPATPQAHAESAPPANAGPDRK